MTVRYVCDNCGAEGTAWAYVNSLSIRLKPDGWHVVLRRADGSKVVGAALDACSQECREALRREGQLL